MLSFEASLGHTDVDFSTHARYYVHNVCLLFGGERVFDHSEYRDRKVGPNLNTTLMLYILYSSCMPS